MKQYLKLSKSNIIISDDDSQDEQHDFKVEKGYFSTSSDGESKDVIQVQKEDELDQNLKERLKVSFIGNMPISAEQKLQLRNKEPRSSDIGTPTPAQVDMVDLEVNFLDYQPVRDVTKQFEEVKMDTSNELMMSRKQKKGKSKKKKKRDESDEIAMQTIKVYEPGEKLTLPPIP